MSDNEECRIFVGGLKYSTTESEIRDYFERYGNIAHLKLVKYPPPDNRSKGFCFVTFESEADKEACVADSPHVVDDKEVEIRLSDRKSRGQPSVENLETQKLDLEDVKFRRLFVGSLDRNWDEDVVRRYFEPFGTIEECTVKRNPNGESLGFAFMTFKVSRDVDLIQNHRPHVVEGRQVETRRQVAKQYVGKPESKLEVDRIWIGPAKSEMSKAGHVGLNDNHTDEELEAYFSQFGKIKRIQQLTWGDSGNTNKKRGYGFIFFTDTDAVDKVVLQQYHVVKGAKLEVKKAVNEKEKSSSAADKRTTDSSMMMNSGGNNSFNNFNMMNPPTTMNTMQNFMQNNMANMQNMMQQQQSTPANMFNMSTGDNMMGMGNMNSASNMQMNAGNTRKRGNDNENNSMSSKKQKLEIRDPECTLMRSIFVGNLNPLTSSDELKEYFNRYGSVVTVDLRMVPNSDRNKGFAFVVFGKSKDVDDVMAAKPHVIGKTNIDVKRKTPKDENLYMDEKVKKIWIGRPDEEYRIRSFGLDETTTDEVLRDYFEKFGSVVDIYQFVWKDTNKKRGYGYITFDNTDVVDKVVLLGVHKVGGVKLQCKKALTKEMQEAAEKKKQNQQQQGGPADVYQQSSQGMSNQNMMASANQMGAMSGNNMTGFNQMNNMMGMNNPMMNQMQMLNQMQQQQSMNPMQNMPGMMNVNTQGVMNQIQQQQQAPLSHLGQQSLPSGINYPPPPAANRSISNQNISGAGAGGGSGGRNEQKFGEMMQNMTSIMGSMQQEVQKQTSKDDTADKMMGMMGNMMSMMSNMASLLQSKVGNEQGGGNAAPAPPAASAGASSRYQGGPSGAPPPPTAPRPSGSSSSAVQSTANMYGGSGSGYGAQQGTAAVTTGSGFAGSNNSGGYTGYPPENSGYSGQTGYTGQKQQQSGTGGSRWDIKSEVNIPPPTQPRYSDRY